MYNGLRNCAYDIIIQVYIQCINFELCMSMSVCVYKQLYA